MVGLFCCRCIDQCLHACGTADVPRSASLSAWLNDLNRGWSKDCRQSGASIREMPEARGKQEHKGYNDGKSNSFERIGHSLGRQRMG